MVGAGRTIAVLLIAVIVISVVFAAILYLQGSMLGNAIASIKEGFSALQGNISKVRSEVSEIRSSISSTDEKLSDLENRVASIEKSLVNVNKSLEVTWSKLENLSNVLTAVVYNVSKVTLKYGQLEKSLVLIKEYIASLKYPITLTDALGRQVVITHEPKRVVSAAPSITEILFAIGAGDRVVGVDKFSNYPPIVNELVKNKTVEIIGGFSTINVEKIALLKPDVVFLTTGVQEKFVRELASMGITVYVLSDKSIEDVFTDILTVGVILNKADSAVELIEQLRTKLMTTYLTVHEYLNKTGIQPKKVYFEVYPDYWTVGRSSFINDVITLAGGENIFNDVETPYFPASPEEIISRNPDVILTTAMYGSFGPPENVINRIKSREGWSNITAVKEDKIYLFKGTLEDIVVRPGPRIVAAVEVIARVLYPQAFNITSVPSIIDDKVIEAWGVCLSIEAGELLCTKTSAVKAPVSGST